MHIKAMLSLATLMLGAVRANIPVDILADYAYLSAEAYSTSDPTGNVITQGDTGNTFLVQHELKSNEGKMWLVHDQKRDWCIMDTMGSDELPGNDLDNNLDQRKATMP